MPLTLTATKGVFDKGQEKVAFEKLAESMLKWHGLTGNKVMTPNVVGSIHIIDKEMTYAGLLAESVVFIEWKVPSFAFSNREIQIGYVKEATQIVEQLTKGRIPKERVWVNVIHAVDGAWGIAGHAYTNEELGAAVAKG